MKIGEIRELMRLLDETSLTELYIEAEDMKLSLKKDQVMTVKESVTSPVAPQPVQTLPTQAPQFSTTETQAPSGAEGIDEAATEDETGVHYITAPMVGTFYRAPSPDADPYVNKGQQVEAKTVVCIVEAMKLMNEIEAEVNGEIIEILADNGQLVEYGQPLFKIKLS